VSKVIELTLFTKPGCHLCEEAKTVVDSVIQGFSSSNDAEIFMTEVNILDDPQLIEKYAEEIPVLQIDGETHAYWRIDAERLTKTLNNLSANN
jgi:glutaredoxin